MAPSPQEKVMVGAPEAAAASPIVVVSGYVPVTSPNSWKKPDNPDVWSVASGSSSDEDDNTNAKTTTLTVGDEDSSCEVVVAPIVTPIKPLDETAAPMAAATNHQSGSFQNLPPTNGLAPREDSSTFTGQYSLLNMSLTSDNNQQEPHTTPTRKAPLPKTAAEASMTGGATATCKRTPPLGRPSYLGIGAPLPPDSMHDHLSDGDDNTDDDPPKILKCTTVLAGSFQTNGTAQANGTTDSTVTMAYDDEDCKSAANSASDVKSHAAKEPTQTMMHATSAARDDEDDEEAAAADNGIHPSQVTKDYVALSALPPQDYGTSFETKSIDEDERNKMTAKRTYPLGLSKQASLESKKAGDTDLSDEEEKEELQHDDVEEDDEDDGDGGASLPCQPNSPRPYRRTSTQKSGPGRKSTGGLSPAAKFAAATRKFPITINKKCRRSAVEKTIDWARRHGFYQELSGCIIRGVASEKHNNGTFIEPKPKWSRAGFRWCPKSGRYVPNDRKPAAIKQTHELQTKPSARGTAQFETRAHMLFGSKVVKATEFTFKLTGAVDEAAKARRLHITRDGQQLIMLPKDEPPLKIDGTFKHPPGQDPKDFVWDKVHGYFVYNGFDYERHIAASSGKSASSMPQKIGTANNGRNLPSQKTKKTSDDDPCDISTDDKSEYSHSGKKAKKMYSVKPHRSATFQSGTQSSKISRDSQPKGMRRSDSSRPAAGKSNRGDPAGRCPSVQVRHSLASSGLHMAAAAAAANNTKGSVRRPSLAGSWSDDVSIVDSTCSQASEEKVIAHPERKRAPTEYISVAKRLKVGTPAPKRRVEKHQQQKPRSRQLDDDLEEQKKAVWEERKYAVLDTLIMSKEAMTDAELTALQLLLMTETETKGNEKYDKLKTLITRLYHNDFEGGDVSAITQKVVDMVATRLFQK